MVRLDPLRRRCAVRWRRRRPPDVGPAAPAVLEHAHGVLEADLVSDRLAVTTAELALKAGYVGRRLDSAHRRLDEPVQVRADRDVIVVARDRSHAVDVIADDLDGAVEA